VCRQKRCKSRSRIRGQASCQPSQTATRPDLSFNTVFINSPGPSSHLETQENYAKLALSEQIFPTPKYEVNDKKPVFFLKGGKKGKPAVVGGSSSWCCCLSWAPASALSSPLPAPAPLLDTGSRTRTESSCAESWAASCSTL